MRARLVTSSALLELRSELDPAGARGGRAGGLDDDDAVIGAVEVCLARSSAPVR